MSCSEAFAHAFAHPNLVSVVFGTSSVDQLSQNVDAWETFERLDDIQRATIVELAVLA